MKEGDYIVGIEGVALRKNRKKKRGQNQSSSDDLCIIYFMKIDEVLTLNEYFNDPRFAKKKCNPNGSYIEGVGDNVYWQIDGKWQETTDHGHYGDKYRIEQDQGGDRVFISSCFSYFGDMGILLPKPFREHVPPKQGIKYARDATDFLVGELEDLGSGCGKGRVGHPVDAPQNLILDLLGTPAGCK